MWFKPRKPQEVEDLLFFVKLQACASLLPLQQKEPNIKWTPKQIHSYKSSENQQVVTRLPPDPWVAGNSPVSSSRYPLDSASSLNLQLDYQETTQEGFTVNFSTTKLGKADEPPIQHIIPCPSYQSKCIYFPRVDLQKMNTKHRHCKKVV